MTLENTAELVPGRGRRRTTVQIRAKSAFVLGLARTIAGEVYTVKESLAVTLVRLGRAEIVEPVEEKTARSTRKKKDKEAEAGAAAAEVAAPTEKTDGSEG